MNRLKQHLLFIYNKDYCHFLSENDIFILLHMNYSFEQIILHVDSHILLNCYDYDKYLILYQ